MRPATGLECHDSLVATRRGNFRLIPFYVIQSLYLAIAWAAAVVFVVAAFVAIVWALREHVEAGTAAAVAGASFTTSLGAFLIVSTMELVLSAERSLRRTADGVERIAARPNI